MRTIALLLTLLTACECSSPSPSPSACCKHCGVNSKACGDACIPNGNTCNKYYGCACEGNGAEVPLPEQAPTTSG